MIDSQENLLNQETQEVKPSEEVVVQNSSEENSKDTPQEQQSHPRIFNTKHEVLERIKEIAHDEEIPRKSETEYLKMVFYKLLGAERDAQQKEFIQAGGDPEKFQIRPDIEEEEFKVELSIIRERRQKIVLQQEEEKQKNLERKLAIIEQIKTMATTPEEANQNFQEFKALQQEWKEIKLIPADKVSELWRNYQLYVEQFYDLLNLNREAREYDFRKNLEKKTKLCETAELLTEFNDPVSAFHQLQELHQEYRETGPVEKELREPLWERFKAASTIINRRHMQHFEAIREAEKENLEKKTKLCEQAELIAQKENRKSADWEEHSKEIMALQAEWKNIGTVPRKFNTKIYERFRTTCDEFFKRKSEFYKNLKARFQENVDKKKAIIEQARALSDSTDWKATAEKLIELQKEWRKIGMVPRKNADKLWEDFREACNKFFDARDANRADTKGEQNENLKRKKEIIEQLKALEQEKPDNASETLNNLIEEFGKIGHVPFKSKERIYNDYHSIVDQLHKMLNIDASRKRIDDFKGNIKKMAERGASALNTERSRLMHRFDQLKQDINTYENNLGFLNASSKKGNNLIEDMTRRIERLKGDLEEVKQKIRIIDAENK